MIALVKKYYWFVIAFTLLVLMGQTLFMTPWQDDNALFFKLAHISEPAGFLGSGIFGEKAYKYTAFFYYPIYLLFGHNEFFYFAFGFLMYGLATYMVYKLISAIFNNGAGRVGGFLYACGFVGSDSFIRLFNSVITSLSIILVSVFIWCYWKFFKEQKSKWYFLSILVFFLASEFARARTHYLIIIPILFETFFPSRSLFRIIPFVPIFFRYVVLEDYRSGSVVGFVSNFFGGNFYQVFGFMSSLTNLMLPGWSAGIVALVAIVVVCIWLFIKNKNSRLLILLFFLLSFIWKIASERIFIDPTLVVNQSQIFIAFLGGELLLIVFFGIFLIAKKYRPLYLFLLMSIIASLASYSFYNPLQVYERISRYFSHSFFFLVMFLSFVFFLSKSLGKKSSLIVGAAIVGWGINNLISSFSYQRALIQERYKPIRSFYSQLKTHMPQVSKGGVLYFDVADSARAVFSDAFSVAQMPDSTAIAWRYGVDRYDFEMFSDTGAFVSFLEKVDQGKKNLRSFYYSNGILTDTTQKLLSDLRKIDEEREIRNQKVESQARIEVTNAGTWVGRSEIQIDNLEIDSILPNKLLIDVEASPILVSDLPFPIRYGVENVDKSIGKDEKSIDRLFNYGRFKESFRKNKIVVSSFWQDRIPSNLNDGDPATTWQADRLEWFNGNQYITIGVGGKEIFSRLAFINSYSDFTPVEFEILSSDDNVNWTQVKEVNNDSRYAAGELVTFDFEPQSAKFFRILFEKTLNDDSPAVSEIWLVPEKYSDLDIRAAEKFLDNPFAFIPNASIYTQLLRESAYTGEIELSWVNNKSAGWQLSYGSTVRIIFDGKPRTYAINLPAGGTKIDKLKFSVKNFPGKIKIYSMAGATSI